MLETRQLSVTWSRGSLSKKNLVRFHRSKQILQVSLLTVHGKKNGLTMLSSQKNVFRVNWASSFPAIKSSGPGGDRDSTQSTEFRKHFKQIHGVRVQYRSQKESTLLEKMIDMVSSESSVLI